MVSWVRVPHSYSLQPIRQKLLLKREELIPNCSVCDVQRQNNPITYRPERTNIKHKHCVSVWGDKSGRFTSCLFTLEPEWHPHKHTDGSCCCVTSELSLISVTDVSVKPTAFCWYKKKHELTLNVPRHLPLPAQRDRNAYTGFALVSLAFINHCLHSSFKMDSIPQKPRCGYRAQLVSYSRAINKSRRLSSVVRLHRGFLLNKASSDGRVSTNSWLCLLIVRKVQSDRSEPAETFEFFCAFVNFQQVHSAGLLATSTITPTQNILTVVNIWITPLEQHRLQPISI